jgi:hypothetical protein
MAARALPSTCFKGASTADSASSNTAPRAAECRMD